MQYSEEDDSANEHPDGPQAVRPGTEPERRGRPERLRARGAAATAVAPDAVPPLRRAT